MTSVPSLQVLRDTVQYAVLLLNLNVMWSAPDWFAQAVAAVLLTQQGTLQWSNFDCLLPAVVPPGVGAAAGAVVTLLLPGEIH
jgi:hypothetical protein